MRRHYGCDAVVREVLRSGYGSLRGMTHNAGEHCVRVRDPPVAHGVNALRARRRLTA